MKKSQLILAAAALVALASCSNEGYTPSSSLENEIGFNAVTRMATRANDAIITGAVYDSTNTFQVWGWQSQKDGDEAFSDVADGASSNFMTDLTISYCPGRLNLPKAWRNATNHYYWPFTGKIGFLAVHPSTTTMTSAPTWNATDTLPQVTIAGYTVTGKDSTDLMFAANKGARQSAALPMVFKHALSQIQFRVRTNADYTLDMVEFKVDSVKINNIALSGDVTYAHNAISWDNVAAQTSGKDYYKTTQVVNYKENDAAADLYGRALVMIPQDKNDATTITIGYTMKQKDYDAISGTVTIAAPWKTAAAADIAAWEVGKKYNYTLCFKLNEITFDPTVTDWVEVDVQTINILD